MKTFTVKAWERGNPLPDYRVEVTADDVVRIYQPIKATWFQVGCWHSETLLKGLTGDKLYIDFGQRWCVTGISAILDELRAGSWWCCGVQHESGERCSCGDRED